MQHHASWLSLDSQDMSFSFEILMGRAKQLNSPSHFHKSQQKEPQSLHNYSNYNPQIA